MLTKRQDEFWKALLMAYETNGGAVPQKEILKHVENPDTNYWKVVAKDLERAGYISRQNGYYTPLFNLNGEFVESEATFITHLIREVAARETYVALILKTAFNSEEMLPVLCTQLLRNAKTETIEDILVITYLLLLLRRNPKKIPKIKITEPLDDNIIGQFTSWIESVFPRESDDKQTEDS
jgi:hypothetical protein